MTHPHEIPHHIGLDDPNSMNYVAGVRFFRCVDRVALADIFTGSPPTLEMFVELRTAYLAYMSLAVNPRYDQLEWFVRDARRIFMLLRQYGLG